MIFYYIIIFFLLIEACYPGPSHNNAHIEGLDIISGFLRSHELVSPYKIESSYNAQDDNNNIDNMYQWIITLKPPITQDKLDILKNRLDRYYIGNLQYLPYNSYLFTAPISIAKQAMLWPSVVNVGLFDERFKLSEHLLTSKSKSKSINKNNDDNDNNDDKQFIDGLRIDLVQSYSMHVGNDINNNMLYMNNIIKKWKLNIQNNLVSHLKIKIIPKYCQIMLQFKNNNNNDNDDNNDDDDNNIMNTLINYLVKQKEVHFIDILKHKSHYIIQNKYAHDVVQSDTIGDPLLWTYGITGADEIIAYADTGLDYDHCMFYDPDVSTPINNVDYSHRKIIKYQTFIGDDNVDHGAGDMDGHGTHIAGTLAGEVYYPDNLYIEELLTVYNGMAPKSKLIVYDYQDTASSGLYLPENISEDYFQDSYDLGSRISSNSWGDPSGVYDNYCRDSDHFIHNNPDFVVFYAAGNYGEHGFYTITSPGVSKNSITVGSSYNAGDSFEEMGLDYGINVTHPYSLSDIYRVIPADYGPRFDHTLSIRYNSSVVYIGNACDPLSLELSNKLYNNIALVDRDGCTYSAKTINVQNSNGILAIIINSESGHAIEMGGDPSIDDNIYNISSVMISKSEGNILVENVNKLKITFPAVFITSTDPVRKMSSFSSRGPTKDGRLKPDIVVPGDDIVSVKTDHDINSHQCPSDSSGLLKLEGTSMSTPVAAGNAALIREYFINGYYPNPLLLNSGMGPYDKDINSGFKPSASLIKAVFIHSGQQVTGTVISSGKKESITESPSYFQGWGRTQLNNVLLFHKDLPISDIKYVNQFYKREKQDFVLYIDDDTSLNALESQYYCFGITKSNSLFKATLVWTDPVATHSAKSQLVNNLDLTVTDITSKKTYIGNNYGEQKYFNIYDNINNVEKIEFITSRNNGQHFNNNQYNNDEYMSIISLFVTGTSIPIPNQHYSLIITGSIILLNNSICHQLSCPNDCSNHGICNTIGQCECIESYSGVDCNDQITFLKPYQNSLPTTSIYPLYSSTRLGIMRYYKYYSLDGDKTMMFRANGFKDMGDPDFYIIKPSNQNKLPSIYNYDYSNTDCDPCGQLSHHIIIPDDEIEIGIYTIGVYGACCDSISNYSLYLTLTNDNYIEYPELSSLYNDSNVLYTVPIARDVSVYVSQQQNNNNNNNNNTAVVGSVLYCNYTYYDDNNYTETGTMFLWFRNKEQIQYYSQEYMVQNIDRDTYIYCEVIVSNSYYVGYASPSINKIAIKDSIPISIYPRVVYMNNNNQNNGNNSCLLCDYTYIDADDDVEYNSTINWYTKNNTVINNNNQQVLCNYTINQQISCTVTPNNAISKGITVSSPLFNFTTNNNNHTILPLTHVRVHRILSNTYTCDYLPIEQPIYTIIWLLNNIIIQDSITNTQYILQPSNIGELTCIIVPYYTLQMTSTNNDFLIDTPPTANDVHIKIISSYSNNDHVSVGDVIECNYLYSDVNNNVESGTQIRWYNNNKIIQGYAGNTLIISDYITGEISCQVGVVNILSVSNKKIFSDSILVYNSNIIISSSTTSIDTTMSHTTGSSSSSYANQDGINNDSLNIHNLSSSQIAWISIGSIFLMCILCFIRVVQVRRLRRTGGLAFSKLSAEYDDGDALSLDEFDQVENEAIQLHMFRKDVLEEDSASD